MWFWILAIRADVHISSYHWTDIEVYGIVTMHSHMYVNVWFAIADVAWHNGACDRALWPLPTLVATAMSPERQTLVRCHICRCEWIFVCIKEATKYYLADFFC